MSELLPERLESEIAWYTKKANLHMVIYQTTKAVQIAAGFAIPACSLLATAEHAKIVDGILGGAIAAIESFVQFSHFEKNWHRWRAAAESLKRERSLFLQSAGPYADASVPKSNATLLAERVEGIIGAEQDDWLTLATRAEGANQENTASAPGAK